MRAGVLRSGASPAKKREGNREKEEGGNDAAGAALWGGYQEGGGLTCTELTCAALLGGQHVSNGNPIR